MDHTILWDGHLQYTNYKKIVATENWSCIFWGVLNDVSTNISVDCQSTYRSLCQSRLRRPLTDSQLRIRRVSVESRLSLYQYVGNTHRYILVADSRPMVGWYFTNGSPIYHRHLANITANTSIVMSLHTSVEWRSSMPTVSREPATSWLINGRYLTTTVYRSIVGHRFADGSPKDHRWMICWAILDRQ